MAAATVTMDNVDPDYYDLALSHKPCVASSYYHELCCGHTVRVARNVPCGGNCTEPGPAVSFICHMCILTDYDQFINEETCSNDLRSLLVDMGRGQMEDAEDAIAEHMAKGMRLSGVAKAEDWLREFLNEHPKAYIERPMKRRKTVGRRSALEVIRTILQSEAARSNKEAGT